LETSTAAKMLIILCGVPGAGKSTLARHAVDHWQAASHASENFASQLGPNARDSAGDFTPEAIAYAYRAMAAAVKTSLKQNRLVLAVGSFRAADQRRHFREIGGAVGARVITVRIACPSAIAATRIRARKAEGENGPDEEAIQGISVELDLANDVDFVISNDTSIQLFCARADELILQGALP
jgi:predicted kinase